jgi:hypothetical protein
MGPGILSTLHFLEPSGSHNGREAKDHFPARQLSPFLCLTILSWSPDQWQGNHSGHIWPAPRALLYPASGLLLGRPLLSLFPHSSWNSSAPAGTGFTISTKNSNSPPPRWLFLLPPPLGTNRFHSVDWWDECRVSLDDPTYSNKTQSFTVSTPKNSIPSNWGMTRPYAYHKFLKKKPRSTN